MTRRRKRARHSAHNPHPPRVLELFLILLSAICLIVACIYMSQVMHSRVWSNPPLVTWREAGAGSLYFLPPSLTFLLSCFNLWAYRTYPMPLVYSLAYSCIMCAGWITTISWWFQCHINLWMIDERFCYQLSLRSGSGKQTYRGVDEGLIHASLAFAIMILILYIIYVSAAGIDFHRCRKGRFSGAQHAYASGHAGTHGGGRSYAIGMVYLPWSGDGGGGWSGGDGGGGGGDGGGGGGGGDGGGGGGGC